MYGHEIIGWTPDGGIGGLEDEEDKECSPHGVSAVLREARTQTFRASELASAMILKLLTSRTVRNKCLLFNYESCLAFM